MLGRRRRGGEQDELVTKEEQMLSSTKLQSSTRLELRQMKLFQRRRRDLQTSCNKEEM